MKKLIEELLQIETLTDSQKAALLADIVQAIRLDFYKAAALQGIIAHYGTTVAAPEKIIPFAHELACQAILD